MHHQRSQESDSATKLSSEVHRELHVQMHANCVRSQAGSSTITPRLGGINMPLNYLIKTLEPEKNIIPESCICQLCRDDVTKLISNPSHVPRWRKVKDKQWCSVSECCSEVN